MSGRMDQATMIAVVEHIKAMYPGENPVPLHAPGFSGRKRSIWRRA